jgi:hypothetical protein
MLPKTRRVCWPAADTLRITETQVSSTVFNTQTFISPFSAERWI